MWRASSVCRSACEGWVVVLAAGGGFMCCPLRAPARLVFALTQRVNLLCCCPAARARAQCGTGECPEQYNSPQRVKFPEAAIIDSVSCGGSHTAAVSATGQMWVWGEGPQVSFAKIAFVFPVSKEKEERGEEKGGGGYLSACFQA